MSREYICITVYKPERKTTDCYLLRDQRMALGVTGTLKSIYAMTRALSAL